MIPEQDSASFRADVLSGLSLAPKRLDPKYFYDQRGSELFEQITHLEEYYPTRVERDLLERHGEAIVRSIGPDACLVEFGSGSSSKTRLLLDRLPYLASYVPVDISCDHLERVSRELSEAYPSLPILPLCADYSQPGGLLLPPCPGRRTVFFFPGSTIGNFHREEAKAFLTAAASLSGPSGGMVIGIDRKKDRSVLERAYNDESGVTAAFNLNILRRINRELGANFDEARFRHHAFFNDECGRIEMHLVSMANQTVGIDDRSFSFEEGESIFTEASYKYTLDDFAHLAGGGWRIAATWTDERGYFSILYLERR
jgi:dimethylhistidine N-methyltransferase